MFNPSEWVELAHADYKEKVISDLLNTFKSMWKPIREMPRGSFLKIGNEMMNDILTWKK